MTDKCLMKAKLSAIDGFGRRFASVNGWPTPVTVRRNYNYDGRDGHHKTTYSVLLRGRSVRGGMRFKHAKALALQMAVEEWKMRT